MDKKYLNALKARKDTLIQEVDFLNRIIDAAERDRNMNNLMVKPYDKRN